MTERMLLYQERQDNTLNATSSVVRFSIRDSSTWLLTKFMQGQQGKLLFLQGNLLKVEVSRVVLDWEKWREIVFWVSVQVIYCWKDFCIQVTITQ